MKTKGKMKAWRMGVAGMFWFDWESRKIGGFSIGVKPEVGDILESEMESGKTAVFEFTEVRPMMDPSDQFFATVKDLHYK